MGTELTCIYCESTRLKHLSSEEELEIYRCFACGEICEYEIRAHSPEPKNRKVEFDDEENS